MLNTKCFCRRWTLLHFMGKLGKLIAAGWMNSCFLILWSWDSVKWRPQGPTGDVEFKLKWISERKRDGASQNQTCCFEFVCIHDVGSAVCRALFHEASVKQADVIKCKNSKNTAALSSLSNTRDCCLFFGALLSFCRLLLGLKSVYDNHLCPLTLTRLQYSEELLSIWKRGDLTPTWLYFIETGSCLLRLCSRFEWIQYLWCSAVESL